MSDYLLIESRSPSESADQYCYELASSLSAAGHNVTIFLVQNGVLPARARARAPGIESAKGAGVTVLADDFSLRERGIGVDTLRAGVTASPLEAVIDHLSRGSIALWH
jgi:predicted peroxiredoxin